MHEQTDQIENAGIDESGGGAPEGRTGDDAGPAPPGRPQSTALGRVRDILGRFGLIAVLAIFIAVFSVLLPQKFPTKLNLEAIVNSQSIVLVLALAATIVLRTGDFDLSIASMMTVTAALAAIMTRAGDGLVVVVLAALAMGGAVGLINGLLVVRVGVSSFITTLGMMTVLGGVAYAVTSSQVVFGIQGAIIHVATNSVLGFPLYTWYAWALVLVFWYVYERTPLGRYMLFVGGSPEAARLAGLPVDRIRILAFVSSSVLASLCGILLAGFLAGIDPSVGPGYLLPPFVGAFLGATTIYVGRFNAFGTLIALYVLSAAITGLQLEGAQPWVTSVFDGGALVISVTLARVVSRSGR